MSGFTHFDLKLINPNFESALTDVLMELNHLRRMKVFGSTHPAYFYQLKKVFHYLESVGSSRIEGNRTTITEFFDRAVEHQERSQDRYREIANINEAMEFVESEIDVGTNITHQFIRELHALVVKDLSVEGDPSPGAYRSVDVRISGSEHWPPQSIGVQPYMDELISFINAQDNDKYDLIKTTLSHHRFTWIHPFTNGNGRVVRLMTYALLIKYGFKVKDDAILNPTAVFCNDRNKYYEMLSEADKGTEEGKTLWCEYTLSGILAEVTKINKLLQSNYVTESILLPVLRLAVKRSSISKDEFKVLELCVKQKCIKSADIESVLPKITKRQRAHLIAGMKNRKLIRAEVDNARNYVLWLLDSDLLRCLVPVLEEEGFIPSDQV